MRSVLAALRRLVIPWGAGGDQPRIVIATDDPQAERISRDAAQAFYWGNDRAFLVSVNKQTADPTGGDLEIWGVAPGRPFQQFARFHTDDTDKTRDAIELFHSGGGGVSVTNGFVSQSFFGPTGVESSAVVANGSARLTVTDWNAMPPATTELTVSNGSIRATGPFGLSMSALNNTETDYRDTVFYSDPEMRIDVPTVGTYRLDGFFAYQTSAAADFKMHFTYSASHVLRWSHTGPNLAGGPDWGVFFGSAIALLAGNGAIVGFHVKGSLMVNAPGQLVLEWAQNTIDAANPTFLMRRSWMKLEKV